MNPSYEGEKREFIRIKLEIPVRYMFLCEGRDDPRLKRVYEGMTNNIGAGGLLLVGVVPEFSWIPDLLMKNIIIGINFFLPDQEQAVKVLTRVSWVEAVDEKTHKCRLGLRFQEITSEDKDKIFQFTIKTQMPS